MAPKWLLALLALNARMWNSKDPRQQMAALGLGSIIGLVGVIVGVVVVMIVLAALLPTFFQNVGPAVGAVSSASGSVGNTTVGSLMPTFALLVAFAAVFSIIALIIHAVKVRGGKGG